MSVRQRNAGVNELAGAKLGPRLFCRAFKRQVRERGVGGVRREGDVVEVGGGAGDLADYEVALGGDVLIAMPQRKAGMSVGADWRIWFEGELRGKGGLDWGRREEEGREREGKREREKREKDIRDHRYTLSTWTSCGCRLLADRPPWGRFRWEECVAGRDRDGGGSSCGWG